MKVLIGSAARSQPQRFQREIDVAIGSTGLRDIKFAYDLNDDDDGWTSELEDCDALLILTTRRFSAKAVEKAKRLHFVQILGTPDRVDIDACRQRGITVSALPDPAHISVAEHTLMFMLCMARQALTGHSAVMRRENPRQLQPIKSSQIRRYTNWLDLPGDSFGLIADKTLGLIGFGSIAQEVTRRARCLGVRIIYTKRTRLSPEAENKFGVSYETLPVLLRTADYVSLHATQNTDGQPLISRKELALMKSGSVFINTARGNQVDQATLIDFLRRGRIAGAALDVFAIEPVLTDEFNDLSNVMLTPHIAGVLPLGRRVRDALTNLEAFLKKETVIGLI